MSSLWEQCKTTMKQKHMRPSPKIRNILNPCKKFSPAKLSLVIEYIKRISLPMLQRTCVRGSMTVEAALVLPLFCFFVISMGNAIEIIRLHGNLEVALWNVGRQIGVYGALPEGAAGFCRSQTGGSCRILYLCQGTDRRTAGRGISGNVTFGRRK